MTVKLQNQQFYMRPTDDTVKGLPDGYKIKFALPPQTDEGLSEEQIQDLTTNT